MPRHGHYVEPFAGGLAVLLAKDPTGVSEVVNDLEHRLTNFWRVMQDPDAFPAFARIISAVPFSEPEWNDAGQHLDDGDPVTRAVAFFIRCRQSLAGRMGTFAPLSRTRTRQGMDEQASAWLGAVEGLPTVHDRLRRVVVLNRPALEVITSQDGPDTLYYCDPPYLPATRESKDVYRHEMAREHHPDLLDALAGIRGKFLLSGYPSELYNAAAEKHGWNRHDFNLPNNAARGANKRRMIECVWSNYPAGGET
jgi:DNA adenine methylase